MSKRPAKPYKAGGVNKASGVGKATRTAATRKGGAGTKPSKQGGAKQKPTNTSSKNVDNFWVRNGGSAQVTVDVYAGVQGIEPINGGTDQAGGNGFSNTFNLGLGGSGFGSSLSGIMSTLKSGVNIASSVKGVFDGNGSFLDKIGGMTGISKSVLSNLNISPDSDLYKQIVAGTNIVVKVAQTGRKLENVDWGNLNSIAGVLSEYTKDNDLFKISDLGVQGQFAAKIINEAVKNGIPDSFEKVASTFSNSEVLKGVLGDILPTVFSTADMNNLKGIVDWVGGEEMRSLFPGLVEEFSSLYKRNWWEDWEDDRSRYSEINGVLDSYDKDWWKTDRDESKIVSTEKLMYGSGEFGEVWRTGMQEEVSKEPGKKLLLLSQVFPATTVTQELRRHFPHVLIQENVVRVSHDDVGLF